jgi:hypothetical protein
MKDFGYLTSEISNSFYKELEIFESIMKKLIWKSSKYKLRFNLKQSINIFFHDLQIKSFIFSSSIDIFNYLI